MARCLTPGAHLAHPLTLNSSSAHSCRTPVALLSHFCRTPAALLSHSCRTPVALLSHPVAHSWLSRCGPPSALHFRGCSETKNAISAAGPVSIRRAVEKNEELRLGIALGQQLKRDARRRVQRAEKQCTEVHKSAWWRLWNGPLAHSSETAAIARRRRA